MHHYSTTLADFITNMRRMRLECIPAGAPIQLRLAVTCTIQQVEALENIHNHWLQDTVANGTQTRIFAHPVPTMDKLFPADTGHTSFSTGHLD